MGKARFSIQGEHFSASRRGPTYEGTIELDASASPKTVNLNFTAGPEKGNRSLGIYQLDADNWRLCLTLRGDLRPTAFAAPAGSVFALELFMRHLVSQDLGFADTPMLPGLPY